MMITEKCEEVQRAIEGMSSDTAPDEMVTALKSIVSCIGNILEVKGTSPQICFYRVSSPRTSAT